MTQPTRLWELSEEIQQLEDAIALYLEDETLTDEERETKLEQAENQANRLRHYLTNQMLLTGQTRIDGVTVKIGLRKKPPRVMLNVPPEELPPEYVKVTYEPKLTLIKELLKVDATGLLGWASFSENHEYSVTIR